ncbi:PPP family 3-phenylpropionic acid transporter [Paenibacillus cellulosilyticus]|uniref:PPP family 3-phenylpropionic acid transporter n=1 Tax=Paenibacillus cellulosilyticus TaxID=375489 RepID=A0A2V2YR43_9BACL|nr:MFS transporter [Paenibacillus cellulosilyticus]PWV99669.1 PPP family 3-phenylpropionic acid transporter [Paenibacillus cellulosilyticus]QKS44894.1 MFS transporter [Paenibacillus cellulosilyticus]
MSFTSSPPSSPQRVVIRPRSAAKETTALRSFTFAAYSTQALITSYFPLYFLDHGFSSQQIGVIYSTGPFISIFANLLMGIASDKYRTIKKLLHILVFGQLVMISLLFPINTFALTCLVMICFYFFQTPINPLTDSLSLLSSTYTGTPYALIRIFGSLGFAVSAYLFGLILRHTGSEYTLPLTIATVSITLLLTFLLRDYQGSMRKMEFSGFLKLLRKPNVVAFFTILLVISTAHRMYDGFLAVTLRQMGASDSLVGLGWMFSAFSEIPVFFLLGKYGHKFKELPLLFIASLLYGVRLLLIAELSEPWMVVATQLMHSITFGIFFSTALRYITQMIPDEYRSSGQAVFAIVWNGVSGVLSGLFGGIIYEMFGRETFYIIAAGLAGLAALGFISKHYVETRNSV